MEESYHKNVKSSPKASSTSDHIENHLQDEDDDLRPPTTSTLTTNIAVDAPSLENSIELESRPSPPQQKVQISAAAVKVPRSQRRGLFAGLSILAEIKDPYSYPYTTKWFIVFIVAYAAAAAPMASAILFRIY
jgi:hypothetical protein